jgi:DNA-binding NarL/FixJ family response regulator
VTAATPDGELDRQRVRVGIIDDHSLVSDALAVVLNDKGFYAVGYNPPDFDSVLPFAREHDLGVILLDLNIGDLGLSLPLIPKLREAGCRVIILTGETSRPMWGACIEAGAECVVGKVVSFTVLLDRVTALLDEVAVLKSTEREELLDSWRLHREEERRRLAPFDQLTTREHEVLYALTCGQSADDIATEYFVSIATVRSHIRSILMKLGVNSQLAAVALAIRAGYSPTV